MTQVAISTIGALVDSDGLNLGQQGGWGIGVVAYLFYVFGCGLAALGFHLLKSLLKCSGQFGMLLHGLLNTGDGLLEIFLGLGHDDVYLLLHKLLGEGDELLAQLLVGIHHGIVDKYVLLENMSGIGASRCCIVE